MENALYKSNYYYYVLLQPSGKQLYTHLLDIWRKRLCIGHNVIGHVFILDKNILDKLVLDKMILDEMLFPYSTQ